MARRAPQLPETHRFSPHVRDRTSPVEGEGMPDQRSVAVWGSSGTEIIAGQIGEALQAHGFRVVRAGQAADVDVVLLSGSLTAAEADQVAARPGRLVPVAVGQFPDRDLPERLRTLNWVLWNGKDARESLAAIADACRSDLADYASSRSLESKVSAWLASGRDRDELIDSVKEVREAIASSGSAITPGTLPADQIGEFLARSLVAARQRRRRRWLRGGSWVALVGVGAVLLLNITTHVAHERERSNMALVASEGITGGRPDVQAIKVAALLADRLTDGTADVALASSLAALLSDPWPRAMLGNVSDKAVNAMAVAADENSAWVASGTGRLVKWDLRQGKSLGSVALGSPVYDVVASDDLSVALATTAGKLHLVTPLGTATYDVDADHVAMAPSGRVAVVSSQGKAIPLSISGTTVSLGAPREAGKILDLAVLGGTVPAALVRRDQQVDVVDVRDGRRLWTAPIGPDELETGALASTGAVALTHHGALMFRAAGGAALKPTGVRVPDLVPALEVTALGQVFAWSGPDGVVGYDTTLGVPLPTICSGTAELVEMSSSSDGSFMTCRARGVQSLWALERPRPPVAAAPVTSARGTPPLAEVSLAGPHTVTVRTGAGVAGQSLAVTAAPTAADPAGAVRLPGDTVLEGSLTTVVAAGSGPTFAVGTSQGEVVELDLIDGRAVALDARWRAPDSSPVRRLSYQAGRLTATTTTATWDVPSCTGCGRQPTKLLQAVRSRQLACYPASLQDVTPGRYLEPLGTRLCGGEGL